MSDKAQQLAAKLRTEGERTLTYFRSLPDAAWNTQVFGDGAMWDVRGLFEHLCISEHNLRRLFEQIVTSGEGSAEDFNVDAFNQAKTGRFASLSREEVFKLYADTRQKTIEFTRGLSDEQLVIRARHPAIGESSLEEQIKLIYLHHQMHVRDVKRGVGS